MTFDKWLETTKGMLKAVGIVGDSIDLVRLGWEAALCAQWISVGTELPGNDRDVLVCHGVEWFPAFYDNDDECWMTRESAGCNKTDGVTRWMEIRLPK